MEKQSTHGNPTNEKVDEDLYSRQLYVIGHEAMLKMMSTKVLVIGLDGLGQEIVKNISLAGIKYISLYDKNTVSQKSLCAGFFFSKSDIGKQRDVAVIDKLKALNKYVIMNIVDQVELEKYDLVVSVNQSNEDNLKINEFCHSKNIKFVMANASGLFTQLFCDFENHTCIDRDGESPEHGNINDITVDGVVTLIEGTVHSLSAGDTVKIDETNYSVTPLNRNQFKLNDYHSEQMKIGGDYEQVKLPFIVEFKSLRESLKSPDIMDFEFSNINKPRAIHDLFCNGKTSDEFKSLEAQFVKTKGSLITPICSVLGGFAAQEIIKGASSKFMPIKQFYYFEASDAYTGDLSDEMVPSDTRYHDMIRIFGSEGFEKIKRMKIFLVGAGAIGCENLKNFVCSGLGVNGKISVTDMDSIEQSNLNRQFLFRSDDISKLKSESAVKRVMLLNEDFSLDAKTPDSPCDSNNTENLQESLKDIHISSNLVSYSHAVGNETENVFSDKFLLEHDLVSNALDNIEARSYMDRRCIQMRRPMIDAGTLGTKGHVQVVIPYISEAYSSSTDPQEKSIPLCTIKSYPYAIEHTIEWAMSEFKSQFNEKPGEVAEYIKEKDPNLQGVFENAPRSVEGCLKAGLALFVENFSTSIQNLLNTFPPNHMDDKGNPFWSPPKRVPSPISFDINDKLHIKFVYSAANLFAQCYNIRKIEKEELMAFLENVFSLEEPNPITFEDTPVDLSIINPIEFDKDSWHANFVYSAANLRARNYGIKEKSKHHIRGIAGRIIPAIATTTAIVSGLATLEIIKYTVKRDSSLNDSSTAEQCKIPAKNYYLDLASPFLASTDLVGPKKMFYQCHNKKLKYTVWSRLEFKDEYLKDLVKSVEDKIGDEVSMISLGSRVVYWNLCDKYASNLNKTIAELCGRKNGQILCYIDVLPEKEGDMVDVAVIFDEQ